MLRLRLEEAVAKLRTGGAVDDADDMALPHWAGVVPLSLTPGTPEPDPHLAAGTPDGFAVAPWLSGCR